MILGVYIGSYGSLWRIWRQNTGTCFLQGKLSAGKCLERFFGIRKDIPAFRNQFVSSDTTQLEKEVQGTNFLKQLAFLTDITSHLNELNVKLQGMNQLVSDLMGNINGFLINYEFSNFLWENVNWSSYRRLTEEFKDDKILDFSGFGANVQEIIDEFNTRFKEFEGLKTRVLLFNNPLGADIEEQQADLQLELCGLQADVFLHTRQENGSDFFKLLSNERNLRNFGRKMTSTFGSTIIENFTKKFNFFLIFVVIR